MNLGQYNSLSILRETDPGLFLGDEQGNEVLLPHKYKPDRYEIGERLEVFVYLDNQQRPIATTQEPFVTLNHFAYLCCCEVNQHGAFMDWGLVKQLFVPFREQARPMKAGNWYVIYLYLDPKTDRLVGSSKTNRFLTQEGMTLKKFDACEILVTHLTEKGANVIINQRHHGLIYVDDIFEDIRSGDRLTAYVKKVRDDKKVDIVLQPLGYKSIEPNADYIMEELEAAGGFLPLSDNSTPDLIRQELGMSKKLFKKAIGFLYREKRITIAEDGISSL